jgi:hypothetical protein
MNKASPDCFFTEDKTSVSYQIVLFSVLFFSKNKWFTDNQFKIFIDKPLGAKKLLLFNCSFIAAVQWFVFLQQVPCILFVRSFIAAVQWFVFMQQVPCVEQGFIRVQMNLNQPINMALKTVNETACQNSFEFEVDPFYLPNDTVIVIHITRYEPLRYFFEKYMRTNILLNSFQFRWLRLLNCFITFD